MTVNERKSILILQGEVVAYRQPLFNALAAHYDVTVLHSGDTSVRPGDRYSEEIIPVRRLGPFYIQNFSAVWNLAAGFDAVIFMFDLRWPAFMLPVFRRLPGRVILHGHRYSGRVLTDRIRDMLMRRADVLLMYGDEEVGEMIRRGINPATIIVAPNTIDVSNHTDFSHEEKTSLLFVGRLQERKRLNFALKVFAQLKDSIDPRIVFEIVGSGEEEAALRALVERLGIADRVCLHGRITDNQVLASYFKRALAYVSPGPVGLGVLHSFAFGVPVLTLRDGRHGPEFFNLVDGKNSLIAIDEAAFEVALLRLCTDGAFASELGRNAYYHYATERTISQMIEGFRAAIDGGTANKSRIHPRKQVMDGL
jgi:glycosyltransferase involved in cell wall biosynthesis